MTKPGPQEALIYLMVIVSASDRDMDDKELARIGAIIRTLPAFADFPQAQTLEVAQACRDLLHEPAGLEGALDIIVEALSLELRETAYALAVDVAAANRLLGTEELRILDIVRTRFRLDSDTVQAINLAAQIRHRLIR